MSGLSIVAPDKLRVLKLSNVRTFISEYEAYSQSARTTTKCHALITNNARDEISWAMIKAREAKVVMPTIEGVEPGEEELEHYMKGTTASERALLELLRILVEPESKEHAQDKLQDEKLALRANLKSFGREVANPLGKFKEVASAAMKKGTSEKEAMKAFTNVFLKNYKWFSSQVKTCKGKDDQLVKLRDYISKFARLAGDIDRAQQRISSFDIMNESIRCCACGANRKRKSVTDRLLDPTPERLPSKTKKPKVDNSTPRTTGDGTEKGIPSTNPSPSGKTSVTKRREEYACFGCGKGKDQNGIPECVFFKCPEGPWVVDEQYNIRHASDDSKNPFYEMVPAALRKHVTPGKTYGGPKKPPAATSDEQDE